MEEQFVWERRMYQAIVRALDALEELVAYNIDVECRNRLAHKLRVKQEELERTVAARLLQAELRERARKLLNGNNSG